MFLASPQHLQVCSLECRLSLHASPGGAFRTSLWTRLQVRLPWPVIASVYFAQESGEHLPDQMVLFFTYSRAGGWLHPQPGQGASNCVPALGSGPHSAWAEALVALGVCRLAVDWADGALALLWMQRGGAAQCCVKPEAAVEV